MKKHYVISVTARCFQNNIISLYSGSQKKRTTKIRENASLFFLFFITLRVKVVFVEDLRLIRYNNRQHEVPVATNPVAVLRVVMST